MRPRVTAFLIAEAEMSRKAALASNGLDGLGRALANS